MDQASPPSSYAHARTAHLGALLSGLPDAIAALSHPRHRMLGLQTQRLRELLLHAKAHSRWHAKRLDKADVAKCTAADLAPLPPMTKTDLMDNWDDIVTDPGVSLGRAEAHLTQISTRGLQYL